MRSMRAVAQKEHSTAAAVIVNVHPSSKQGKHTERILDTGQAARFTADKARLLRVGSPLKSGEAYARVDLWTSLSGNVDAGHNKLHQQFGMTTANPSGESDPSGMR
eukprot:scaffold741_cov336-Pavlova_lutheri.AAC.12